MKQGQNRYWYLDKTPDILPTGNGYYNQEYLQSEQQCFQQEHLYTVELLGTKSDIIERRLFGDIDRQGAQAIAFLDNEDAWKTRDTQQSLEHL